MNRCSPFLLAAAAFAACGGAFAQAPIPTAPILPVPAPVATPTPAGPRAIDLAICLDISGSMDGLINQARQNLWSVVNELATLQPAPTLRVALLTFGCSAHDAAQGWVEVETDFTSDLDLVSQRLFALTTNGGDEYVARVMQAALEKLSWSKGTGSLQLLFVAGNEAATQDPSVATAAMSKAAIARGIVVNSIYCGDPQDQLAPAWREVAKLADGQFAAIEKDATVAIVTPFDEQLTALSTALNATYVAYGAQREAWVANQGAQDSNASVLNSAAAAQRCQTKASALYCNPHWDLVDACDAPRFELAKVKKEELPEPLRALTEPELRAHVAAQKAKRGEIRAKVEALGRQRDEFVRTERTKLGSKADALFEQAVLGAVRAQAAAKGFRTKRANVDSPFSGLIEAAARDYAKFVRVTGEVQRAPTDCRMGGPAVRRSAAEREHGEKLYLLYARLAEGVEYVKSGEPAVVGQTLVKESWQALDAASGRASEATARYHMPLATTVDGKRWHAGDLHGLFVMHKLAADTPDTDQGWVYGTVDRDGVVTAAGRIASCMRCHEGAAEDRRFGLR